MVAMRVHLYPSEISGRDLYLKLIEDESQKLMFGRLRAFLIKNRATHLEFNQSTLLSGHKVWCVPSRCLTQAFFGEFNRNIALDYLAAYRKHKDVLYLKLGIRYLYKAVKEHDLEAKFELLTCLKALKNDRHIQEEPELKAWTREFDWYLAHLKKLAEDSNSSALRAKLLPFERPVNASVQTSSLSDHHKRRLKRHRSGSLNSAHDPAEFYQSSALPLGARQLSRASRKRNVSVSKTNLSKLFKQPDANIRWLAFQRAKPTEEQAVYFGDAWSAHQKQSILLEVFVGELMRAYIGFRQPWHRVRKEINGQYTVLSQYVKIASHYSGYQEHLLHAGRCFWANRLFGNTDDHPDNYLIAEENSDPTNPNKVVVAIDNDLSFMGHNAELLGRANLSKFIVLPTDKSGENVFDDTFQFDEAQSRLSFVNAEEEEDSSGDPYYRQYVFHLDKTEDDMGKLTVRAYDQFPAFTEDLLPINSVYREGNEDISQFQQDPVFKNEQHFLQTKFFCAGFLDESVAATVLSDHPDMEHQVVFELQQTRLQQLKVLQGSAQYKAFLNEHKQQIGYAILFETFKLCEDNEAFVDPEAPVKKIPDSVPGSYVYLLKIMGISVSDSLEADLLNFLTYFTSENVEHAKLLQQTLSGRVSEFYQKTGMSIEANACSDYATKLYKRIDDLQIKANKNTQIYKQLIAMKGKIDEAIQRIAKISPDENVLTNQLKANLGDINKLLGEIGSKEPIDEKQDQQYQQKLLMLTEKTKFYEEGVDMFVIGKGLQNIVGKEVATPNLKNKQHFVRKLAARFIVAATDLISQGKEETLNHSKQLIRYCGMACSRRRHVFTDAIRDFFRRIFRRKPKKTKTQQQWENAVTVDSVVTSELKSTFAAAVQYTPETIFKGDSKTKNWAGFFSDYQTQNVDLTKVINKTEARLAARAA